MGKKLPVVVVGVIALLGGSLHTQARAAEAGSPDPLWGDLFTRPKLAANWGGIRDEGVAKGVTVDASLTQIGQGVVSGGKSGSWEYGGRGNVTLSLDTQKLGLWPGGFATVEFESNWSSSVNGKTGALNPANTSQLFPVPGGEHVALPQLSFAQFVSPYAGAIIGKLDTMSGCPATTTSSPTARVIRSSSIWRSASILWRWSSPTRHWVPD